MIDKTSTTWQAIEHYVAAELKSAGSTLETSRTELAETEFLRGKIKAYRAVLALAEPKPQIPG